MLDDVTFVTSLQIESKDRIRNAIAVFSYLVKKIPEAKIYIKEVDSESKFLKFVLPEIENIIGKNHNIIHLFEESVGLFNKSKILNDLVLLANTEFIWNYDVDVLLPITSYIQSYNMLKYDEYDIIYPYGCGVYQWNVLNFNSKYDDFINDKINLSNLIPISQKLPSVQGHTQVFKKQIFLDGYGWNENFIFVGYEDTEFLFRMSSLGYKIGRVDDDIYHLDHVRINNINYSDQEFFEKNIMLWEWIRRQDKETIIKYYENQNYISRFK
jgi:predicted glycosyltransferase involved in capsule biosynthesis